MKLKARIAGYFFQFIPVFSYFIKQLLCTIEIYTGSWLENNFGYFTVRV